MQRKLLLKKNERKKSMKNCPFLEIWMVSLQLHMAVPALLVYLGVLSFIKNQCFL